MVQQVKHTFVSSDGTTSKAYLC